MTIFCDFSVILGPIVRLYDNSSPRADDNASQTADENSSQSADDDILQTEVSHVQLPTVGEEIPC